MICTVSLLGHTVHEMPIRKQRTLAFTSWCLHETHGQSQLSLSRWGVGPEILLRRPYRSPLSSPLSFKDMAEAWQLLIDGYHGQLVDKFAHSCNICGDNVMPLSRNEEIKAWSEALICLSWRHSLLPKDESQRRVQVVEKMVVYGRKLRRRLDDKLQDCRIVVERLETSVEA